METIHTQSINIKENDCVLDLGCGEGRHTIAALFHHPQAHVYYLDLSINDIKTTQKKIHDFFHHTQPHTLGVQATGINLPFGDQSFDHIICSEVLEHIPAYQLFLTEITRILKPNGTLTISVPRYWPEKICWALSKEYYSVPGGHVRIFRYAQLKKEIESLPFLFLKRHWAHALHVPYWWLKCAFWSRGDDFILIRWYHKLLVWDLIKTPAITRWIEKIFNPLMGKSVVMYFRKTT